MGYGGGAGRLEAFIGEINDYLIFHLSTFYVARLILGV